MKNSGLESTSDPPTPTYPQTDTIIAAQPEGDTSKPTHWYGFDEPPVRARETMTADQSQRFEKQPVPFGFYSPQALSPSNSFSAFKPSTATLKRPSFGNASFGSASFGNASLAEKPSFGSSPFCSYTPVSSPPPPSYFARSSAHSQHPELSGNDVLSKAIRRTADNRPALFGRQEVCADSLIANYIAKDSTRIDELAADLASVAKSHPTTMRFLQHIFEQASQVDGGALAPPRPTHHENANSDAEVKLKARLRSGFDDFEWEEEWDYIIRMIVLGLPSRDIRAAITTEVQGRNHVSTEDIEDLIDFIDGPMANLVERVEFKGSALDMFRPSAREEKRFSRRLKGGEPIASHPSGTCGDTMEGEGTLSCRCNDRRKEVRTPKAKNEQASKTIDESGRPYTEEDKQGRQMKRFRFMDLPPEMRCCVLKAGLTPGYISLRSCPHHLPAGIHPRITTPIFQTSKVINKEAEGLLFENTIIVNASIESGTRPAIHRKQLPEHILPHIKSLVIVVDFTRVVSNTARVADFRAVQGLTDLNTLRICGIAMPDPLQMLPDHLATYLRIILERVPAGCEVLFGEKEGGPEVEEHVQDMVRKMKVMLWENELFSDITHAYPMGGERLESVWKSIEEGVDKGCKSGRKEDFWFEERRTNGELDRQWLAYKSY